MKIIDFSKTAANYQGEPPKNKDIHLFCQFFIHRDKTRYNEIKECLRLNTINPHITHIHLLNERIYTIEELGLYSNKIIQTTIGVRLKYNHIFKYIRENTILGYYILANSDIFFDETISKLLVADIHCTHDALTTTTTNMVINKKMFALLRYEYNGQNIQQSTLFGPRFDSQDTWIFHSSNSIQEPYEKIFNFQFGQPGCDNKMLYLMKILGYEIYNDPQFIKTYHYHSNPTREYSGKDAIKDPWAVSVPYGVKLNVPISLGIDIQREYNQTRGFQDMQFEDNTKIHDYIAKCIATNQHFIIPRISGIENNMAVFARMGSQQIAIPSNILNYFKQVIPIMKNNAGIKMTSMESIMKYSNMYLKAFDNSELYCGWESQGNYIHHIAQSHEYMKSVYSTKQIVWSFALDIFHYIYSIPWTYALRGKRVLIISPFETSILEKIPIRKKIYGIDLFPDCEILTIKPPQTQADETSREFDVELAEFCARLDAIKDTYDIALISAGGYGNLICNHIYETGKSAIYVGGVLQMYFGILGSRWLKERPDVVRLFLNEHWSRPKMEEKPKNCEKVEKGCYW